MFQAMVVDDLVPHPLPWGCSCVASVRTPEMHICSLSGAVTGTSLWAPTSWLSDKVGNTLFSRITAQLTLWTVVEFKRCVTRDPP